MEGQVNYNEIYRYYAVADVFVLPTLEDNWSLVIPEAMACGLPVATSIYNGCHVELIHEGENGCVFDTLDESSLLEALAYFHDKDLAKMGQRSVELEKYYMMYH
jgi:glycosyltransferase involved in cell wall biosynthesis